MKTRIEKYNDWIHRNIFLVTLIFAFWISVAVVSVFYGIYLGQKQRGEIRHKVEHSLKNQDTLKMNENIDSLREILKKY